MFGFVLWYRILWLHQQNVQLHFGNLDFDVCNFEQLFQLYRELSLQEYNFDFDFYSLNYFMNVLHFGVSNFEKRLKIIKLEYWRLYHEHDNPYNYLRRRLEKSLNNH